MLVANLAVNRIRIVLMSALRADVKAGLVRWKFGQAFIAPGKVGVIDMAALQAFHRNLRTKKTKKLI